MPQALTIFALYGSREPAESAADKLIRSGVTSSDISVLLPDQVPALAHDTKMEPKLANQTPTVPRSRGIFSGSLAVLAWLSMLALPVLGTLVVDCTHKAAL